jgi:4-hydroxybenzoyl-CoA thioesterase
LLHEARVQFLRANEFSELDVDGAGIIMADSVIVYRSEAFYGETMIVDVAVDDFARVGCDILYRISDKDSGREVVRAKTEIVFFDYETRKAMAVPQAFKTLFDGGS